MFLVGLMLALLILFVCLVLVAACGYIIIESWFYIKKKFNLGKRR